MRATRHVRYDWGDHENETKAMNFSILPSDFDAENFLRHYWQKKPLLIRHSGRPFVDPVAPDELAGFACEEFIESRLVSNDPATGKWTLRNGPFTEHDFAELPETQWSLLVQAMDQWHEGVRRMLREFAFIPSWRIDDIMISFASDGGGVGPHFDHYDVFLIQGLGSKRWRLGGRVNSTSQLLPGTDLRLLQTFNAEDDWIVEPGDILYLPPNVAHHGVAIGDSITYSIGFRTPSVAEILDDFGSEVIQGLPEDHRYVDTAPQVPERTGEITPQISRQLIKLLQTHLLDPEKLARWFGRYMTSPKYPELVSPSADPLSPQQLRQALADGAVLVRNPASRFAFVANDEDGAELHVDGTTIPCTSTIASLLPAMCNPHGQDPDWGMLLRNDDSAKLLTRLYNQGSLLLDDEGDD